MNALKFGLDAKSIVLPCEDPAEYDQLRQFLLDEHQPSTVTQLAYVDIIAVALWKHRRYQRAEEQEFAVEHLRQKEHTWFNPAFQLAYPTLAGDIYVKLRRAAHAELRAADRALDQLRRLKRDEAVAIEAAPVFDDAEPEPPAAQAESPEPTQSAPPEPPLSPAIAPDPIPPDSETVPDSPERRVA